MSPILMGKKITAEGKNVKKYDRNRYMKKKKKSVKLTDSYS